MDRRTQILEAAFAQMAEKGLEDVHARTVAARLNLNHATIHYYFPSRSDLLIGIAEFTLAQLEKDRAALGEASDAREKVENELALFEAYAKPASRMGSVLVSLNAARKGQKDVGPAVEALMASLLSPIQEAVKSAKTRKSSPFGEGTLIAEVLLGLVMKVHMTGDTSQTESLLDEVMSLLFKA